MVASESSDLHHVAELGVLLEDVFEVLVLEAEYLLFFARFGQILVLVLDLEDERHIAEVAARLEADDGMALVFVVNIDHSVLNKKDCCTHHLQTDYREGVLLVRLVEVLIGERRYNLRDQFVVSLEAKLRVHEQHVEAILKTSHNVFFNDLDL